MPHPSDFPNAAAAAVFFVALATLPLWSIAGVTFGSHTALGVAFSAGILNLLGLWLAATAFVVCAYHHVFARDGRGLVGLRASLAAFAVNLLGCVLLASHFLDRTHYLTH
jgi:hypothetical protein